MNLFIEISDFDQKFRIKTAIFLNYILSKLGALAVQLLCMTSPGLEHLNHWKNGFN